MDLLRQVERVLLPQDRALQALKLGAGDDAELPCEGAPGILVGLKCLGLASGTVEREHELGTQPLPERMVGHQHLQLPHNLCVVAQREVRIEALLEGGDAKLVEASDLRLRERLVREVGQRRSSPQAQGLVQER